MEFPGIQSILPKQQQGIVSEEDVKSLLGIKDFRHLSKERVISFVSAIPQMDPEVAKKVVDQFPKMADMAVDLAKEYRETLNSAIAANDKSAKDTAEALDKVIDICSNELNRTDLTTEERLKIIDVVDKALGYRVELHKNNQDFLLQIIQYFGMFAFAIATIGATATLGGNGGITLPFKSNGSKKLK